MFTINILSILLFTSSMLSAFLAFFAWKRRNSKGAHFLALLMMAATIWSLGYGLEISLSDLLLMRLASTFSYIGIATLPVFFLLFCIRYSNIELDIRQFYYAPLFLVPLITFGTVASNEYHFLFYSRLSIANANGINYLQLDHSFFYYLHIVYSHFCIITGVIILIRLMRRVALTAKKRILFLLGGAFIPYLVNIAYVFGYRPYDFLDLTPIGFISMGIVLTIGVFTVKLFEITPLALDILFDSMPEAIFVLDDKGNLINKNPKAIEILSIDKTLKSPVIEALLKNWSMKEEKNGIQQLIWNDLVFELNSTEIKNKKGHPIGQLLVLRDITERSLAEKTIIDARKKAEESEKLKTAFLTNMSHEIRTPMNGILGFINLLKNIDISSDERASYIEILNESGQRLLDTINDIMAMSEIDSGAPLLRVSRVDIEEVFEYWKNFFAQQIGEKGLKMKIRINKEEDALQIQTDKVKLNGILSNLIKNAIKFTNQGEIEMGATVRNGLLVLFVRDTGIGISTDKHEMIFERFSQVDVSNTRPYEGSGLGLSIVKAYVQMLGGRIWLESYPGIGSTFFVEIPNLEHESNRLQLPI